MRVNPEVSAEFAVNEQYVEGHHSLALDWKDPKRTRAQCRWSRKAVRAASSRHAALKKRSASSAGTKVNSRKCRGRQPRAVFCKRAAPRRMKSERPDRMGLGGPWRRKQGGLGLGGLQRGEAEPLTACAGLFCSIAHYAKLIIAEDPVEEHRQYLASQEEEVVHRNPQARHR